MNGFVGTDEKRFFDAGIESGFDHVLTAENVGFNDFERVVFGDDDLFQGGGVDNNVGAAGGAGEAIFITNIADEKTETEVVGILLLELVLFEFIAGKNPNGAVEVFFCQKEVDEGFAE